MKPANFSPRRRLLPALGGLIVLSVAIVAIGSRLAQSGEPRNDPAAQALYWRAIDRLIRQPRFELNMRVQRLLASSLPGQPRQEYTESYRLRHIAPDRTDVVYKRPSVNLFVPPFGLRLVGHTLCVADLPEPGSGGPPWGCAPTHRFSMSRYVNAYLIGGEVTDLRYVRSPAVTDGPTTVAITVYGRGRLGCTPIGAGAGIDGHYSWYALQSDVRDQTFSATLTLNARTGLPAWFNATQSDTNMRETGTFQYGGHFSITLPKKAQKVRCMSWVPAIHCVELKP